MYEGIKWFMQQSYLYYKWQIAEVVVTNLKSCLSASINGVEFNADVLLRNISWDSTN
jgi:hypothetical protein